MAPEKLEIRFQILSCLVSIKYEDPGLTQTLYYMDVQARQAVEVLKTLSYTVSGYGPYAIYEESDLLDRVASGEDVLFHVYRRVYCRVLDRYVLAGWVVLHAGAVRINGYRMGLLGDKGAGKTTVMTRLLFAGHQLEGDELLLARGDQLLAVPRRLHLKPGIEKTVPELAGQLDDLPVAWSGELKISALDPTSLGFDWQIAPGTVDQWIWIAPNHGGDTKLEKLASFPMMQRILESYLGWGESKERVVNCAAGLAKSGGQQLLLGDAEAAVKKLELLAESRI